jgi:hypothetical protein
MVSADKMDDSLIERLVVRAKSDENMWRQLKELEIDQMNPDGTPKLPSGGMLIDELVRRECGFDHNFQLGALIVRLRYHIRKELGLPV